MMARKKSQDPSVSSEERKNNMGALPHMAVLTGERPILVAIPWVLVPKGVQATGFPRPTASQSPNGEEDTSGRLGMPGHRTPGMPGHTAPATRWSLSTGQIGEKETSSLPITGHRPSSLQSLELAEFKGNSRITVHRACPVTEQPSTGHRTAEYNSEYC